MVTGISAWLGIKMADRGNLPMPFLRPWELRQPGDPAERRSFVRVCVAIGGIFGLCATLVVHVLGLPGLPGGFAVRAATFPFVAIVPEIVAHLFVMSGLLLLTRRNSISIVVSALVILLFFQGHNAGAHWLVFLSWGVDYLLGVATGWVYSRYGIEGAVLTHAVASAIILGIN